MNVQIYFGQYNLIILFYLFIYSWTSVSQLQ